MSKVELREFESGERELSKAAVDALRDLKVITEGARDLGGNRWRVEARERVGCVRVDGIDVWVHPKTPISRLLYLAGYGRYGMRSYQWRDDEVYLGAEAGVVPVMAIMLAKLTSRAFQPGLLHGYREREESLSVMRGRMRMGDQTRRHPGMPLPLEVTYQELHADTPENRRLLAAIRKIMGYVGVPAPVYQQLVGLSRRLASARVPSRGPAPPRPPATRLNRHYQPALDLADVILEGNSLDQVAGETMGTGFLLDMDDVFQDYLAGMLATRLRPYSGRVTAQHTEALILSNDHKDDHKLRLRPDIVWRRDGKCIAVLDAKYKGDSGETGGGKSVKGSGPLGVQSTDVYQVFTYCKALGTDQGHLIHADTRSPEWRSVEIDGVTITVHAMNLNLPWAALQDQEARLVSKIAV